jgi:hypothetical protein
MDRPIELFAAPVVRQSWPQQSAQQNHCPPSRLPLINLNSGELASVTSAIPGGMENVQDIYPLTPLQEGLLFHHLFNTQGDTSSETYLRREHTGITSPT